MGSACVFFDLLPTKASISDFNPELVQFFIALRDIPEAVVSAFQSLDATGEDYYSLRVLSPTELPADARAARFLYLNRFAFNGVYRTNRMGQFNVPRGIRTGALPTAAELLAASSALQAVTIEHQDYLVATQKARRGDFVYLDPPYRNTTRATYGEYGYDSFGSQAHVSSLAEELKRLDALGRV